jgi:hypothetical protein
VICFQFGFRATTSFQKASKRLTFLLFLEHERDDSTTSYGARRRQDIVLVTFFRGYRKGL